MVKNMAKALVVDDSATVRSIIAKMLLSWGINSVQAENGQEALDVLGQNSDVSIALVDWNMPVMSGIEFVRQARGNDNYKAMKIVMVTTETEMHQVIAALEAGVDEYIMKPFTKEIFEEKLNMVGITKPD
jgi:two-component system chemotaxis response regulator CheY